MPGRRAPLQAVGDRLREGTLRREGEDRPRHAALSSAAVAALGRRLQGHGAWAAALSKTGVADVTGGRLGVPRRRGLESLGEAHPLLRGWQQWQKPKQHVALSRLPGRGERCLVRARHGCAATLVAPGQGGAVPDEVVRGVRRRLHEGADHRPPSSGGGGACVQPPGRLRGGPLLGEGRRRRGTPEAASGGRWRERTQGVARRGALSQVGLD